MSYDRQKISLKFITNLIKYFVVSIAIFITSVSGKLFEAINRKSQTVDLAATNQTWVQTSSSMSQSSSFRRRCTEQVVDTIVIPRDDITIIFYAITDQSARYKRNYQTLRFTFFSTSLFYARLIASIAIRYSAQLFCILHSFRNPRHFHPPYHAAGRALITVTLSRSHL